MSTRATPLRIAIVNDYEIVVAGVAAALEPFADRVEVVELDSRMRVVSDVDVVLYDTFGQVQGDSVDLDDLLSGGTARVVIFTWNIQPELVQRAMDQGAAGYLSKALTGEQIVEALEAVRRGEAVLPNVGGGADGGPASQQYPGRSHGLSNREAEVLALITQGLSNQEIAERTYLSINSVKTYIRTAYRKIDVSRRSQAVVWGMQNGLAPDRSRHVSGAPDPR
jgi:NarL family two-component system response regulator LiaR